MSQVQSPRRSLLSPPAGHLGTGVRDTHRVSPSPMTDGLVAVVKRECPACQLVVPVLEQLAAGAGLTVFTQDDPAFPADAPWVVDDTDLSVSWGLDLEAVPTLLRFEGGQEVERTTGWMRDAWEDLTGQTGLGPDLPAFKPG
jgi:hypothetical protein